MDITLPTLIDLFITTKKAEGKSAKTLRWYQANLERFADHLGTGAGARLSEVTVDDTRDFVSKLQTQDIPHGNYAGPTASHGKRSPFTVHGYVRTLRVFSRWAYEEGFTSKDIFARLQRPKLPDVMVEVLSDQEIDRLIGAINPSSFLGARLYTIVLILLDTGIRATELCTLTLDKLYLEEEYFKVTGKGNKERILPFGAMTKKALLRYLHSFRPDPVDSRTRELILTPEGLPLTYTGLFQAIKRLGKRAGVPRLHPHLFRHTFAVRYLINGGDLMTLKRLLGHESLEVTQMYLHLAEAHIQVQHRRFSPVDRLGLSTKRRNKAAHAGPAGN